MNHSKSAHSVLQRRMPKAGRDQLGAAILELAMVLPILVTVAFAGPELSRYLRTMQFATAISREAASIGLRECLLETVAATADTCLSTNAQQKTEGFARSIVPGTDVIVSLYRYNSSTDTVTRVGFARSLSATHNSKVSEANVANSTGPLQKSLLVANDVIVVGEAYVPNQVIVPRLARIMRALDVYYDISFF